MKSARPFLVVLLTAAFGCAGSAGAPPAGSGPAATAEPPAAAPTTATPAEPEATNRGDAARKDDAASEDCFDYLTEMVRSSNFPFNGLDPKRINLVIDEDAGEVISAQVVYQTEGSGITGWVRYEAETKTLYNTSAYLETPQKLRFPQRFAADFERCRKGGAASAPAGAQKAAGETGASASGKKVLSLREAVQASPVQSLPVGYDYDFVTELPGFVRIPDADLQALTGAELTYGAVRKLPPQGIVQPILVSGRRADGETPMYLATLDAQGRAVHRIVLYAFQQGAQNRVTTFRINAEYSVTSTVETQGANAKVVSRKATVYTIGKSGRFIKAR